MLNSDTDKQKFESWLSTGLKNPVSVRNDFAERLLARLDAQQGAELLQHVRRQENIYRGLIIALVLAGAGILFYPPVTTGIFTLLQTVFVSFIDLILEPTLTGLVIPAGILLTVIAVIWNLLDMVSLE
jgi:hypothetical protein